MIFVTLGSQKFQFNRLLIWLDELMGKGLITEEIFAQIGYSDYVPKNFAYKNFLDRDEFTDKMKKCSIVITHGGTGAIITALKNEKRVIAIARRAEFGEHVDDHQEQIVEMFSEMGYIYNATSSDDIFNGLNRSEQSATKKYISNTISILESIDTFISSK